MKAFINHFSPSHYNSTVQEIQLHRLVIKAKKILGILLTTRQKDIKIE